MEIFKNKFLVKLIASICLFLALFNFAGSTKVYAGDDDVWGGVLINPIVQLLTVIADSIMEILHTSVQSQELSIIKITGSETWWQVLGGVLVVTFAIVAAAVFIVAVVGASGGIAVAAAALAKESLKAAFVAAAANVAGGALVGGIGVGIITGFAAKEAMFPEDIYLPAFSITAEQIFRNELALFDVNFFNPGTFYTEEIVRKPDNSTEVENNAGSLTIMNVFEDGAQGRYHDARTYVDKISSQIQITVEDARANGFGTMIDDINAKLPSEVKKIDGEMILVIDVKERYNGETISETIEVTPMLKMRQTMNYTDEYKFIIKEAGEDEGYLNIIHTNEVKEIYYAADGMTSLEEATYTEYIGYELADAEANGSFFDDYETQKVEITSTAAQLQGIVSTWYLILRNFSLLVLMLLLIYSGIRIAIGSTAGEKAKYKERLMDWLVAICLIFIMHYIMVFAVEIVEEITGLVGSTVNGNMAYLELTEPQRKSAEEVLQGYDTTSSSDGIANAFDDKYKGSAAGGALVWPTDLAGLFKLQGQMTEVGTTHWVGYSLCYVILVLFTLFFAFTYAKRVLYMAFLTMIAPLVAMTYPIDKITDGKAQAFDSWLKEYIFNLMIQPLHLLLYTILVSSAFELASTSPIYALVAVGFMMPAEKLMRRFFGFEKAKTPGLLSGAAGAALAMTGMQKLMGGLSKGKHNHNSKVKEDTSDTKWKERSSGSSFDIDELTSGTADTVTGGTVKKPGVAGTVSAVVGARTAQTANTKSSADESAGKRKIFPEQTMQPNSLSREQKRAIIRQKAENKREREKEAIKRAEENKAKAIARAEEEAKRRARIKRINAKPVGKPVSSSDSPAETQKEQGRWKRTVAGVADAYQRELKKKVYKRVINGNPVGALVRGAAALGGGAFLATSGAVLGTMTGEPTKVLQYGSTGALLGANTAGNLADAGMEAISVDSSVLAEEAERSFYGEDYKNVQHERAVENKLMSKSNIDYVRDSMGWSRQEAEDFLSGDGREYYNEGIKDIEDIVAVHEALNTDKKEERVPSKKQAINAAKLRKNLPTSWKDMTAKKQDEWRQTYEANFRDNMTKNYSKYEQQLTKKYYSTEKARKQFTTSDGKFDREKAIEQEAKAQSQQLIKNIKNIDKAKSRAKEI